MMATAEQIQQHSKAQVEEAIARGKEQRMRAKMWSSLADLFTEGAVLVKTVTKLVKKDLDRR